VSVGRFAAIFAVVVLVLQPATTQAASPPFLTLLFSRTQVTSATQCTPLPQAVRLDTAVAPELKRRGHKGTGTLVLRFTGERALQCYADRDRNGHIVRGGAILGASWAAAGRLRDRFGWAFVSHSRSYRDMTRLAPAQQHAESCGTLPAFRAHGHNRADGLFAYPNNRFTASIQRNVVSRCFDFARAYGGGINTRAAVSRSWLVHASAVDGGACNIAALQCYRLRTPQRYASPAALGSRVARLSQNQWMILQGYRFVRGQVLGRFDCTGADWRSHWTTSTEEYCWSDYLKVLDRITRSTRVVDPKTVAVAWGRAR
jgi:hypothetical protein